MMRLTLISLAVFAAWHGDAQQYFPPKVNYDTVRTKIADYEAVQLMDTSGNVMEEGFMKNNKLDGVWTTYHPTGFPATTTSFRNGKKNGSYMRVIAHRCDGKYSLRIAHYPSGIEVGDVDQERFCVRPRDSRPESE